MKNGKEISNNIIFQVFSFVVNLCISFILTPYITEQMGKEVYGYIGLANQFTSFLLIFMVALNGMVNIFVATNYHQKKKDRANVIYSTLTIVNNIVSVIVMILLLGIVYFLEYLIVVPQHYLADIKVLWLFLFIAFFISQISCTWGIGIYIKNRVDIRAKATAVSNVIKAGLLIALFSCFRPGIFYVGVATLIANVIVACTNLFYLKRFLPEFKVSFRTFQFSSIKEVLVQGFWTALNRLSDYCISGLDLIITNWFISPLSMNYISFAQAVATQFFVLVGMVYDSFLPTINELYAQGKCEQVIDNSKLHIKISGFICSVPMLGFLIWANTFYSLWLPQLSSDEHKKVALLAGMITIYALFEAFACPLNNILFSAYKLKITTLVSAVVGVMNIVMELVLLRTTNLGVYAIEIATAVLMSIFILGFIPLYSARVMRQKWYVFYFPILRCLINAIIVSMVYAVIYWLLPIKSWLGLGMIGIICGLIGYVISLFFIFNSSERKVLKNEYLLPLINKLKKKEKV